MIYQARCGNGKRQGKGPCCINFEFADDTKSLLLRGLTSLNEIKEYDTPLGIAGPYLVWCLAHKQPMHFRKLKAIKSTDACGQVCQTAIGDKCKCSCGGLMHGVAS